MVRRPADDVLSNDLRASPAHGRSRAWAVRVLLALAAAVVVASSVLLIVDATRTFDTNRLLLGDVLIVSAGCDVDGSTAQVSVEQPADMDVTLRADGTSDVTITGAVAANGPGCRLQVFRPVSRLAVSTLRVNDQRYPGEATDSLALDVPARGRLPYTIAYRSDEGVSTDGLGRGRYDLELDWGFPAAASGRESGLDVDTDGLRVDVHVPSGDHPVTPDVGGPGIAVRNDGAQFGIAAGSARADLSLQWTDPAWHAVVVAAPLALAAGLGVLVTAALAAVPRRRGREPDARP